jgi:hypothetical protein
MTRTIRLATVLASAAASVLFANVASAGAAAETIGQTGTVAGSCGPDAAYVQKTLASGPSYSPRTPGVITSWSVAGDQDPNQTIVLMVLRQDGATKFTSVGNDVVRTLTPNVLNTFTGLHLPIEANQRLAVYLPPGSNASCVFETANPGDTEGFSAPYWVGLPPPPPFGLPPVGVPFDYAATDPGFRINAQAVVDRTGKRDAAIKKCKKTYKKNQNKKKFKKCKKKAKKLPG